MTNSVPMKKARTGLYVYGALMLLVMVFIFVMSAQDGDDSGALSNGFLSTVLARLVESLHPERFGWSVELVLRKCAHMFEFFCLSITSFLFFGELLNAQRHRLLQCSVAALAWSFLYACTDEWHQTFVPGRAGRFTDVLIDSCGALIGVLLALLLRRLTVGGQNR